MDSTRGPPVTGQPAWAGTEHRTRSRVGSDADLWRLLRPFAKGDEANASRLLAVGSKSAGSGRGVPAPCRCRSKRGGQERSDAIASGHSDALRGSGSCSLAHGADPRRKNGSGSRPLQLAVQNTGRGGSGTAAALEQQRKIIRLLEKHGARPGDMHR